MKMRCGSIQIREAFRAGVFVGFSVDARQIITVILLRKDTKGYWGVNAWISNTKDRKAYLERQQ